MDAELSQLVQRFQRLQQEEVQSAISERNAVEIATAIVQKKLLELLFTTDAKEYLTWDQLRREVVDEVMASGGRLNVVDLPSLLSVSPQQIERVMANVLEDDRLLLEGGELISTDHLDGLVAQAQDRLTEEGSLAIADFASTHRLTSTFALHLLTKAITDGRLHAVMDKGATYTTDFVQAQCIMARAGLMAATKQICMEDFVRRHHLFLPLLDVVIERIAAEVPGTFDGHLYSPHAFASYRREQIDNVYRSNGFVGYAVLQRLGVANPRLYMLQRFNGVEDVLLANTREEVVAATKSKGKKKRQTGGNNNNNNNASASVSSSVVGAAATEEHPLSGFALANGFLADRSISGMVGLQQLEDEEVLALHLPPQLPVGVDAERDGLGLLPHFIHHFGRLADCIYLPEHALFLNPKAGDVVREVVHGVLHPTSPSSAPQQQDSFDLRSHPAAMEALAEKLHLGPVEECGELLMAVVEHWSTVVDALVAEAQLSQQDRANTKRKHAMAQLQQQMQQAWIRINLLAKGIAWAQAKLDESALQSISRQVLSSHGLQLCRLVVMNEGYEAMMEDVEEDAAAAITTGSLRKKIRTFKTATQKVLLPLVELVEGKDLNALVDALEESSTSGSIAVSSFYQPNKKMEREASAAMIHELRGHLETCSLAGADAAAAGRFFAQACSFLLHACARVHVEVSGKAVSAVVAFLRQEPGVSDTLAEVHGIVVEALNQQSLSADAAAALEAFRHKVLMGEGA